MVTDKLKELEATRAKLAALEQAVQAELKSELAALPAQYGFANVAAFVAAVRAASGRRRGRPAKAAPAPAGKRRRRAKVTDATRAEVKKLVDAGKTGAEIAKSVGVSLPTVQNIKKALGLVRKKKS
jgi:DNA invertase Pin-like site-specific DNA recombinase